MTQPITALPKNMEFVYYDKDSNKQRDKSIQIVKINTDEGSIYARRDAETGEILQYLKEKPKAQDFSELTYWKDTDEVVDKTFKNSILGNLDIDDVKYDCEDGEDDGHITFGKFMKVGAQSFVKHFVKPVIKHPVAMAVGAIGLALAGPQIAGFLALGGLAYGGYKLLKGIGKFFFMNKETDAEQIKAAEDMWTGGITAGLSWIGVRKSSSHLSRMRAEKADFNSFINRNTTTKTVNVTKTLDSKGILNETIPKTIKIKPTLGQKLTWYKHYEPKNVSTPTNIFESTGNLFKGTLTKGEGVFSNMKYSTVSKAYKLGAAFMPGETLSDTDKKFYYGEEEPKNTTSDTVGKTHKRRRRHRNKKAKADSEAKPVEAKPAETKTKVATDVLGKDDSPYTINEDIDTKDICITVDPNAKTVVTPTATPAAATPVATPAATPTPAAATPAATPVATPAATPTPAAATPAATPTPVAAGTPVATTPVATTPVAGTPTSAGSIVNQNQNINNVNIDLNKLLKDVEKIKKSSPVAGTSAGATSTPTPTPSAGIPEMLKASSKDTMIKNLTSVLSRLSDTMKDRADKLLLKLATKGTKAADLKIEYKTIISSLSDITSPAASSVASTTIPNPLNVIVSSDGLILDGGIWRLAH